MGFELSEDAKLPTAKNAGFSTPTDTHLVGQKKKGSAPDFTDGHLDELTAESVTTLSAVKSRALNAPVDLQNALAAGTAKLQEALAQLNHAVRQYEELSACSSCECDPDASPNIPPDEKRSPWAGNTLHADTAADAALIGRLIDEIPSSIYFSIAHQAELMGVTDDFLRHVIAFCNQASPAQQTRILRAIAAAWDVSHDSFEELFSHNGQRGH